MALTAHRLGRSKGQFERKRKKIAHLDPPNAANGKLLALAATGTA
jgi:hypothetical protein